MKTNKFMGILVIINFSRCYIKVIYILKDQASQTINSVKFLNKAPDLMRFTHYIYHNVEAGSVRGGYLKNNKEMT